MKHLWMRKSDLEEPKKMKLQHRKHFSKHALSLWLGNYSLGILKLLADGFGFAGPLLLNLIVTFIETKQEPEYHGYLYACGLLLSTFLGTICSTQFDYNSQVKMHSGFLGWFRRDKQNWKKKAGLREDPPPPPLQKTTTTKIPLT